MVLTTLTENEIIASLIALALLLACAYLFGTIFEWLKAPRVVGEISGGIFLGGSFLFYFFPDWIGSFFLSYEQEGKVLNIFYQMGLSELDIFSNESYV